MEDDRIYMLFAQRQLQRRLSFWALGALLIIAMTLAATGHDIAGAVVAAVALLGQGLFEWRLWRCPSCDAYLGRDIDTHCTHCGTRLKP